MANKMNKVLVIGSCGAGKSSLAKRLSEELNLPLTSLDQCYWLPEWTRPETEKWREKVKELVAEEKWVIEGNYQSTFDIRIPASNIIVWLDPNRFVCLWRVIKRRLLKNRVDPLRRCREKVEFKLIKWVLWDYPGRGKRQIIDYLNSYNDRRLVVLRSGSVQKNLNRVIRLIKIG